MYLLDFFLFKQGFQEEQIQIEWNILSLKTFRYIQCILDESHPMPNAVESILAVFLMSLGRDLTAKYHYPLDCSLSTFIDIPYKNYYVPGVHILDTL